MNENLLPLTNGSYANCEPSTLSGLFNIPLSGAVVTVHPVASMIRILVPDESGVLRWFGDITLTAESSRCELMLFSPASEVREVKVEMSLEMREQYYE